MATKKNPRKSEKGQVSGQKRRTTDYGSSIIIRFTDGIDIPYEKGIEGRIEMSRLGPWNRLNTLFPGIQIEPLYGNIDRKAITKLVSKAREMDPGYTDPGFFNWYRVVCPVDSEPTAILKEMNGWKNIRKAYIKPQFMSPALVNYNNNPLAANASDPRQFYLDSAPAGISAKSVWDADIPGSTGSGIKYIDIEKGWKLDHTDLPSISLQSGNNVVAFSAHGTSVLGIISAVDNSSQCVGIAPAATGSVVSSDPSGISPAILESLLHLSFGDILLIEEAAIENEDGNAHEGYSVPVETVEDVFNAIRLASALGIVVVEPGGDGDPTLGDPVNLDDYTKIVDGTPASVLNRSNPDEFRDSGAILVTAGLSPVLANDTHELAPWAPYGSRCDCYAWGENIVTLSTDAAGATSEHIEDFGGTSGASAIIAGALLSIQGMSLNRPGGYRLGPDNMRVVLHDSNISTDLSLRIWHPTSGETLTPLGIFMPDLQKYAATGINAYPDLYMRDNIGDSGDPHTGGLAKSPDIILKNAALPGTQTPQAAFGEGSLTEENVDLSNNAILGQNNYLYARVKNRGGVSAAGAYVRLFYSVPSTLLTPNLLTPVELLDPANSFAPVLPNQMSFPGNIPADNTLAVTREYGWLPVQLGTATHYCFVALAGCDADPAPDLTHLKSLTWDQYRLFIRNNNNITWRNFNMVTLPPPAPLPSPSPDPEAAPQPEPEAQPVPGQVPSDKLPREGWVHMDFISPGLPDRNKVMELQVRTKLPKGAYTMLEMPFGWKRDVFKGSPYIRTNLKRKISYRDLTPDGITRITGINFRAKSVTPLRLYVFIPPESRKKSFLVAVSQMVDNEEVGRVTWKLVPSGRRKKK
jgi:hypothetical protein